MLSSLEKRCNYVAQSQVVFIGITVLSVGLRPDSNKVKSISDMPSPTGKACVQHLLTTINYLGF